MPKTVFLFDIDGTLVNMGGIGRRAVAEAFEAVTGRADACEQFRFDGMTDKAIARRGLQAVGHADSDDVIAELISIYLTRLRRNIELGPAYEPLPGAREWIGRLSAEPDVALGLGTGNVEAGARFKLAAVQLSDPFGFGGFGCDHEDRRELIRAGAIRGAQALGGQHGDFPVVVVGDTPRDVDAAHAVGGVCMAVATGHHSKDALREAGADYVGDTLFELFESNFNFTTP